MQIEIKGRSSLAGDGKHFVAALQLLSHVRLFATPWTAARQPSSVLWILQARMLVWVAMPFSRGSSRPRDQTLVSCIGRWILYPLTHLGSPICLFMTGLFDFTKRPESSSML